MISHIKGTKWSVEELKIEALNYTTKKDFQCGSNSAYQAAWKECILDDICGHMDGNIRWTLDDIKKEALKYSGRKDFEQGSRRAYMAAQRMRVLDSVCNHMDMRNTYWTKEMIHEQALKYKSRTEFSLGSSSAYGAAWKRGILDLVCGHMENIQPRGLKYRTSEVVEKFIAKHGNKYDYSKVEYNGCDESIIIICKIHGEFNQSAGSHLSGCGCRECGFHHLQLSKILLSTDRFIENAISVHGEKYIYSLVKCKTSNSKVEIVCKEHGVFLKKASKHLSGQGCPRCSGKKKYTTEEFIASAESVHGNKYYYSKVEYIRGTDKVKIVCKVHGLFYQNPSSHLVGQGCPSCAGLKKLNTNDFILKAIGVHGVIYDYSLVEYKATHSKVRIICKKHGEFKQSPAVHLQGMGCQSCSVSGFNPKKQGNLYYIKFESETESPLYKIGITNFEDVNVRIKSMCVDKSFTATILAILPFQIGAEANELEQALHKEYAEHRYYGDDIMSNGNTELFVKDVLGYDTAIR